MIGDGAFGHLGVEEAGADGVDGDRPRARPRAPATGPGRPRRAWPPHRGRSWHSPSARRSRQWRSGGPSPEAGASPSRRVRKMPVRFTAIMAFHWSSVVRWKGALSAAPALAMTMSQGPACREQRRDAVLVGDIGRRWRGCSAGARRPSRQRLGTAARDHHLGPGLGKAARKVGPRAGPAAGDQHASARQRHARITSCARSASRRAWSRPGR